MAMVRAASRVPPLYCRLLLTRKMDYPFVQDLTKDHLLEREHTLENMYFWKKEQEMIEKLAKPAGAELASGIPATATVMLPDAGPFLGLTIELKWSEERR